MYYSEELIEEIRTRNDIVDVISGYVRLQKKGSSYFGLCPFHNEKSPSFSVSRQKQMYYCFGCGAGGNVYTFLMEYENFSFVEAVKYLADRAGIELPEVEYSKEAKEKADLRASILEVNKLAAKYYYVQLKSERGKAAYTYLKDRKLSDETITAFGLGYSNKFSDDLYKYLRKKGYSEELIRQAGLINTDEKQGVYDKFWNRVMFPIMDVNSRVIGFGGRVMGDAKPKYLNSPETKIFDKSRNLYGLNFARSSRKPNLIICEGYMDVISMHQAGFNQAVASLGTALTVQQSLLMKRYTNEVLVTYDSDEAGTKAALRAIPILREAGLSVRVINMKPYKDPDEFIKALGTEAFQERIDQAQSSFLFEVEVLERGYNLKDPAAKTAFFDETAKKLLAFSDELERNNYIEAVASRYGVAYETLRRKVNQLGMVMGGQAPKPKPRELSGQKKPKEEGTAASQKLLLTWAVSDPGYFRVILRHIKPEDFSVPLYRQIAEMLWEQQEKGQLNPAGILSRFENAEEQREAAAVFNAVLKKVETKEEMEKALQETVYKVKQDSLNRKARELAPSDMEGLQQLVKDRRDLEKLHISLD